MGERKMNQILHLPPLTQRQAFRTQFSAVDPIVYEDLDDVTEGFLNQQADQTQFNPQPSFNAQSAQPLAPMLFIDTNWNKNPGVKAMKPLDGYLKTVEKDTITSLKNELIEAASSICAKHGLKCFSVLYEPDKKGSGSDLDSFSIRIGISRVNVLGMDVLDNNFLRYASEKGMRPEWYGSAIVLENTEFVITGLDPMKNMVRVVRHDPDETQLIPIDRVLDYMRIINQ